jgi:hypothetical protein
MWEMNHTLRVTRNHPFIEEGDGNCSCEMRHLIRGVVGGCVCGVGCTGVCFSGVVCTGVIMLNLMACLDPEDSLSTCQRWIGFLASPEELPPSNCFLYGAMA